MRACAKAMTTRVKPRGEAPGGAAVTQLHARVRIAAPPNRANRLVRCRSVSPVFPKFGEEPNLDAARDSQECCGASQIPDKIAGPCGFPSALMRPRRERSPMTRRFPTKGWPP